MFQSLFAGGGVVLQQRFDGLEDLLGFEHGKHLLIWDKFEDIDKLIDKYLHRKNECKKMAREGKKFVENNYTFDHFVERILKKLKYVP